MRVWGFGGLAGSCSGFFSFCGRLAYSFNERVWEFGRLAGFLNERAWGFGGLAGFLNGRAWGFGGRVVGGVALLCVLLLTVSCQSSPSPGASVPQPTGLVTPVPSTNTAGQPGPARPQREYNELFRPQFHFSARSGWIADPNGMVRWQGLHHLF